MNNEMTGPVQTAVLPSFLDDPIDLKRLLSEVKKHTKASVEAIVAILEDPKTEPKVRLAAASKLLDIQADVAKIISQDGIQRLVAEVRLNPSGAKKLVDGDDKDRPLVDFSNIQEV